MMGINEKKIYYRFLKNKKLFLNKYIEMFNAAETDEHFISIFDTFLTWAFCEEGDIFWYKIQIEFLLYLIDIDYKCSYNLIYFLERYIQGYTKDKCKELDWYKEYMSEWLKLLNETK